MEAGGEENGLGTSDESAESSPEGAEGCGDGNVEPGLFCHRFMPLPPLGDDDLGDQAFSFDIDGDGTNEAAVVMDAPETGARLRIFGLDQAGPKLAAEVNGFTGVNSTSSTVTRSPISYS